MIWHLDRAFLAIDEFVYEIRHFVCGVFLAALDQCGVMET